MCPWYLHVVFTSSAASHHLSWTSFYKQKGTGPSTPSLATSMEKLHVGWVLTCLCQQWKLDFDVFFTNLVVHFYSGGHQKTILYLCTKIYAPAIGSSLNKWFESLGVKHMLSNKQKTRQILYNTSYTRAPTTVFGKWQLSRVLKYTYKFYQVTPCSVHEIKT